MALTDLEFRALLDEQEESEDGPFDDDEIAERMREVLTDEQWVEWCATWELCDLHHGRDIGICWDDGLNCHREDLPS